MHAGIHTAMDEVFFALCKGIDTPVSLGAWLRYRYSHTELASMDIRPRDYDSTAAFKADYAACSLLSKYKGLRTGIDLEGVALQKFKQSEVACKETNERFRRLETVKNSRLHGYLHSAQRKISKLLGPFSLFAVSESYGWGPGATLEISRRRAFVDSKVCELPITVSRSARSLLRNTIEQDLHWSATILRTYPEGPYCLLDNVFELREESRVETVPKNAKTHRIIAVEPRGNGFLQKGFGGYIRDRLRTVGVNLDDQTRNQELARQAGKMGLATLDLRAASDTISKEVIYSLLPYDWAASLDAVRTRRSLLPSGEVVVLEKFSSMGNGFTFELESMIFWALVQSVIDEHHRGGVVAVYGDDLIFPSDCSTEVCMTLQFCGFTVNDEKSFFDGRFYESCGKHYFDEQEVTPAYQKEELDELTQFIRFGNRLIRLAQRLGSSGFLDSRVEASWRCIRRLGGFNHLTIPLGSEGDDGWLVPYRDFHWCNDDIVVPDMTGVLHHSNAPYGPPSEEWYTVRGGKVRPGTAWHANYVACHGISCRVLASSPRSFIANERALLAWSMRRGVVTEVPYLGEVKTAPERSKLVFSKRRVIPSREFSLHWTYP